MSDSLPDAEDEFWRELEDRLDAEEEAMGGSIVSASGPICLRRSCRPPTGVAR